MIKCHRIRKSFRETLKKNFFLYFQILKIHRRRTLKIFLSMIILSPCTSINIVRGLILLLKEIGVCVKIVWGNKFHPLWKLLGFKFMVKDLLFSTESIYKSSRVQKLYWINFITAIHTRTLYFFCHSDVFKHRNKAFRLT